MTADKSNFMVEASAVYGDCKALYAQDFSPCINPKGRESKYIT
jgi:hypothetical protein